MSSVGLMELDRTDQKEIWGRSETILVAFFLTAPMNKFVFNI